MSEKTIASALGLRPLEELKKSEPDIQISTEILSYDVETNNKYPDIPEPDKEVLEDLDYAKKNIMDIIEKGKDSLDELIAIAKQTESARAFEVASNIMKTMLDANKQLIDTSKEKKYEKTEQPAQHTTNVTNNTLMLTTEEMLTMLKNKRLGDA